MVNYAPSGLWSVRVRESEKVLLQASDVIGEVQRYWEALYAKRPVNLPAFERLVRAHIPKGVPEEWRSVQDYTLQDLKDAVRQAVADDNAPGSNRVTAALIAELPEPVQGAPGARVLGYPTGCGRPGVLARGHYLADAQGHSHGQPGRV